MNELTSKTTIQDFLDDPELAPYYHYLFMYDYLKNEDLSTFTISHFFGDKPAGLRSFARFGKIIQRLKKGQFFIELDKEASVGYWDYSIENPKGTVFIIAGGGYSCVCTYEEGFPLAEEANAAGYSAFVCVYKVGKFARLPGPIDSVADIIKDVYKRFPNKVNKDYLMCGASAAGHLVACFAEKENGYPVYDLPKPKGIILLYPVVDLTKGTLGGTRIYGLKEDADNIELQKLWSPLFHVTPDFPKTYLVVGTDDPVVPRKNNAIALDKVLTQVGVEHIFQVISAPTHGFGDAYDYPERGYYKKALDYINN